MKLPFEFTRRDGCVSKLDLESCPNLYLIEPNDDRKAETLREIETSLKALSDRPDLLVLTRIGSENDGAEDECRTLPALAKEVESRYRQMTASQCRNIEEYRNLMGAIFTHIIFIEEMEDLNREEREALSLIARKGRAAGLHVIAATGFLSSKLPHELETVFNTLE